MKLRPLDLALRIALGAFQNVRRAIWSFTEPKTFGAHAIPVTPKGRIVLVKLRYAPGWRFPGGGRKESEDPAEAALRELEEEIGLVSHGSIEPVAQLEERPDRKRDTASLFIVRDAVYRPRWSLEVESVTEADPDRLPADMSGQAMRWLAAARALL